MSTSVIKLDNLPGEVQDLIFDWTIAGASRDELKAFRLSNRFFRDRTDKTLFATLHISASNLSLQRLKNIADRSNLASHVRELIFHRGTFSGHRMCRMMRGGLAVRDYGDFEEYIVQNRAYAKHLPRVSRAFVSFDEEVHSENEFNRDSSWRTFLYKECQKFSRLEQLTTLNGDQDIAFSTYFDKRCGLQQQSFTPNYFAPYEIMSSTGPKFRPKLLSFDAVNGEDLAAMITQIIGGADGVRRQFSSLRKLHLTFSETVISLPTERSYDYFFQSLNSLEWLSLGFPTFGSEQSLRDPNSFHQRLLRIVLAQHYTKLTHFCLQDALMGEDDYIHFLARHASTLQSVRLFGWGIPPDAAGKITGSIYRAMYRFGQLDMPDLTEVLWNGQFSNSNVVWYDVDNRPSPGNVNPQFVQSLYDYMLGLTKEFPGGSAFSSDARPDLQQFTGHKTNDELMALDDKLSFIRPMV